MTTFTYPEQDDRETDAQYWERVRQSGLPFPWERDKANPPGPITVDYEWWTRDSAGVGWKAKSEEEARGRIADPGSAQATLHRRVRWVSVGEWEDVQ